MSDRAVAAPVDGADEALIAELAMALAAGTSAEPIVDPRPPIVAGPAATMDLTRVVGECLERASLVGRGGAFIEIFADALDTARPGGRPSGRLEAFTVAVKDLLSVTGHRMTAGSLLRSHAAPETGDAEVVCQLRSEGAVLIGTTALHEFAFGVTGINHHTGTPINPRVPSGIPGGSSSGSAVAVAQGAARVAIGTDTGGSVRIPAALCGIVGFKPRYGTYSVHGVFPLAASLDHVGLLARTVADVRTVHAALGHRLADPAPPSCVGLVRAEVEASEPEVGRECERALRRIASRCRVIDVNLPAAGDVFAASTAIMFSEAAAVHGENVVQRRDEYGSDVLRRLLTGRQIPAVAYVAAQSRRQAISRAMNEVLSTVDFLVGPTVPILPPPVVTSATKEVAARLVAFTRLANVAGCPALTLPLTGDGPPVGLQISAATNDATLGAAQFVERLLG